MKLSNVLSYFALGTAVVSAVPVAESLSNVDALRARTPNVTARQTTLEGLVDQFLDVVKDEDSPAVTDLASQIIATVQTIAAGATGALPGIVPRQTSIEDLAAQLISVVKDGDSPAITELLSDFIAAATAAAADATDAVGGLKARQLEIVTGLVGSLTDVLTGLLSGILGGLGKRQVDASALNLDAILATVNAILAILGLDGVAL